MERSKLEFDGWDWTELYEPLVGSPAPEGMSEEDVAQGIRDAINEAFDCFDIKEDSDVPRIIRAFLSKLASYDQSMQPFVIGLANVEHDWTLLQLTSHYLEYLWD